MQHQTSVIDLLSNLKVRILIISHESHGLFDIHFNFKTSYDNFKIVICLYILESS